MPERFLIVLAAGVLGLLIGSFLNVVIARVPEGRSIVRPSSACPRCQAALAWYDNIPLLSWLLLRGSCRTCATPIALRYPMVELISALLWSALTWWALGSSSRMSLLPLLLVLASAGLALAVIDLDHHRLPDVIVLPLYPVTLLGLLVSQLIDSQGHWLDALTGAAIWGVTIAGLWLITAGRGMGLGDAKLAPVLGATVGWLGIAESAIGLLAAFALGAITGLVLIVSGQRGRGARMAFGPFLLGGALIAVLFGEILWQSYAQVMGL